ncbi:hypothetical protein [Nitratifractor salsuginis]|uniref:FAD/FMN-containing dehydrogenase n=1 Tax=Nitratifractor salsuginis (strain DSM 16511 / JCM 12458 / E9I37-1) TaxID=749222 RepID=E6X2A8_NITSE|nr:hypothetical protein [Nitratifractor salsuginis]ADV46043.1 hypothetical protein Nitsa_0778 [Nitratifractor salsuginis DSM 16511]
MKKILLILSLLIVVGGGLLFALKGKSSYEPEKYSLQVSPEGKPFGVGSTLAFTLPDQFGKSHSLSPDTRTVAFAFSKKAGHIIRSAMQKAPAGFLQRHHAVLIADISGMPTVIQNLFALPDLRKSHYSMLLIYDKNMAKRLEQSENAEQVVVMHLDHGKVSSIEHAESPEKLLKLLSK